MIRALAPQPTAVTLPVTRFHRLTVEQYHKMIEQGILTENDRVELLEGLLIEKMSHDPLHANTLTQLQASLTRTLPAPWVVRMQLPVTLRQSEPEPDFLVARGPIDEYDTHHPTPRDTVLVVEVSNSTLDTDRGFKLPLYALERLPVYWIVNPIDRCVEVYTQPRAGRSPSYRQTQTYTRGQTVPVVIDGEEVGRIAVAEVMP